ncbi:uracil-DNA glycosylase family protein [Parvularcula mediterranea]|uniref:uracil-DNA glycosylase family protein n=1 Tax=Parvularcula mediterranea TaxID=2732508 RepID=UPI001E4CCC03|nr:uracil-DNA glycosylase family protein [Parvularcula mediterranea]
MATPELRDELIGALSACRHCEREGLIPEARPIFQLPEGARIGIFSQAPGNLAHQGGKPFLDPSGVRLRQWLGVDEAQFYDSGRFAIAPMAFCFPGYDGTGKTGKGGDLPPPKVCAEIWRKRVLGLLEGTLEVALLVGSYSQDWHLGKAKRKTLTETVRAWRDYPREPATGAKLYVLPHPSWRNTAWLRKNPWFEEDIVPEIQADIQKALRD